MQESLIFRASFLDMHSWSWIAIPPSMPDLARLTRDVIGLGSLSLYWSSLIDEQESHHQSSHANFLPLMVQQGCNQIPGCFSKVSEHKVSDGRVQPRLPTAELCGPTSWYLKPGRSGLFCGRFKSHSLHTRQTKNFTVFHHPPNIHQRQSLRVPAEIRRRRISISLHPTESYCSSATARA
jgi:hypothetical protein